MSEEAGRGLFQVTEGEGASGVLGGLAAASERAVPIQGMTFFHCLEKTPRSFLGR